MEGDLQKEAYRRRLVWKEVSMEGDVQKEAYRRRLVWKETYRRRRTEGG